MSAMAVELFTEPLAPPDPWVLTSILPDVKISAGPYAALPEGSVAVSGGSAPFSGSVTDGSGPLVAGAPPNRPTLV
jgi:hypothetical protein